MFATFALTALFASVLVRADVVPNFPGPNDKEDTGTPCHIGWAGDTVSKTPIWQNMAIELMTGDNYNMTHLTTVATGLDGTVAGTFDHDCPAVTINAPIYFYQFSSPAAANKTWTTRFTIAGVDGSHVDAPNPTQPGTGDPIPWGLGALVDSSTAVPAPGASSTAPTDLTPTTTPMIAGLTTSSGPSAPTTPTTSTASRFTTSIISSAGPTPSANSTGNGTSTQDNAAAGLVVDSRVWQAAVAITASAMAFAILL